MSEASSNMLCNDFTILYFANINTAFYSLYNSPHTLPFHEYFMNIFLREKKFSIAYEKLI